VPQLTEREALDLHELIQANSVTIEKLGVYANQAQDPALRQILSDHQRRHIRGQNEMINHVQQASAGATWGTGGAGGTQQWNPAGPGATGQAGWGQGQTFASAPGYSGGYGTAGYQPGGTAGYGATGGYAGGMAGGAGQAGGMTGMGQAGGMTGAGRAGSFGGDQKLSDRAMATDCLNDCKHATVKMMTAATEASSPTLRQSLANLSREHLDMAYDMFKFLQSRGWYQAPNVSQHVLSQVQQEAMRQQPGMYAQ